MRSISLLLFSFFCGSLAMGLENPLDADTAWSQVLEANVTANGRVDFACLDQNRGNLDSYISYVARVSPHTHPEAFPTPDHVLAYHLNTYNALAMHNVLEFDIPQALEGFFYRLRFFYLKKKHLGGRKISLYHYENDVIRPLGDPRVHFALNCMAVSCPRLPQTPFTAERLDADLERLTREFFADPEHLEIEHDKQRIRVSEILDFYPEDFLAESDSLAAYVNRYVDESIPATYDTVFFDYDWTVNAVTDSSCSLPD